MWSQPQQHTHTLKANDQLLVLLNFGFHSVKQKMSKQSKNKEAKSIIKVF